MTTLAPQEPTVREFEATVATVTDRDVVLDETYFYAESGGQPADRGTLAGIVVEDVQKRDGDVVHTLATEPAFTAGETVTGVIDDDFRTYCMRAHTASHLLYGAGRRLLDDLGYGGFDIDAEKVRVDLRTSTEIDDETLIELERLTNRAVWDSRPVTWEEIPPEDAREQEGIAFNTKTEEGVMADADAVRIVDIAGWDVAACGGTHVSNTKEIGPIEVLDRSNPGEGLTRVEFAVGPPAIDHRAEIHGTTLATAGELGTSVASLTETAQRILDEKAALESELASLKDEVLAARLESLPTVERNGATWRVGTVSEFGPNEVGDRLRDAVGSDADTVAIAGRDGTTFVVVASAGAVDAGDIVAEVTDEFGGGGGGSPSFAQGGGIDADPEAVIESLRE